MYHFHFFQKYINNFSDIDVSLLRNEVLDEPTEESNQQGVFNSFL